MKSDFLSRTLRPGDGLAEEREGILLTSRRSGPGAGALDGQSRGRRWGHGRFYSGLAIDFVRMEVVVAMEGEEAVYVSKRERGRAF